MNICIPIETDQGINSQLSLHFSQTPKFIIVNTETMHLEVVDNNDANGRNDQDLCLHLASEKGVEAVVVGGIALEALSDLQSAGLCVYASTKDTVKEIVSEFVSGNINPVTVGHTCTLGNRRFGGRGFGGFGCGGGANGGCAC